MKEKLPLPNLGLAIILLSWRIHGNPGGSRHSSGAGFGGHGANESALRSRVPTDAPIGNNTPKIMRPTIVAIFTTVSQYSTSPNRRTLSRLKRTDVTRNTDIQTAWLTSGNQKLITTGAVES